MEAIFKRLYERFGPQGWWPGETKLEIVLGAILTQSTSWNNVERAIKNLKESGLLDFSSLLGCSEEELAEKVKPSGFSRQKAKRIKDFLNHVKDYWDGDLEAFLSQPMDSLRRELLSIKGIGLETADSILLYAGNKPSFVVDRYTYRIMSRHGYSKPFNYETLRSFFMEALDGDVNFFKEYHALFVRLGKDYCRAKPLCSGCPLEDMNC